MQFTPKPLHFASPIRRARLGAAQLTVGVALWILSSAALAMNDEAMQDVPVRYRVVVDAPRALAEALRNTLDIVR